jgi:hypothetical protein
VLGALIAVFAVEIRRLIMGRRTKNALAAQWSAEWTVTNPPNHPKSGLVDTIEFTSFTGDEFKGSGQNPDFGKYDVEGRDAKFAVSLLFRGQEASANLIGTAILTKDPLVETLRGPWAQYTSDAIVVSGTVVMKKRK